MWDKKQVSIEKRIYFGFSVITAMILLMAAVEAARETAEMIDNSVRKAHDGTKIASDTAEALYSIIQEVERAAVVVAEFASASQEQAQGLKDMVSRYKLK